jgi:hypothetical protein
MQFGGKNFQKRLKKRVSEEDEYKLPKEQKKKRDKTTWRMLRSEQKDKYEL